MHHDPQKLSAELAKIIRGDVFADILHRAAYSSDASIYRIVPACVVAPRDKDDVVAVVKYAAQHAIPIVARGGASGTAGESLSDGIVMDTTRYMNNIVSLADKAETITAEPGVALNTLNNYMAKYGKKIGPDPASGNRATLGGCTANNSTGAHSLQYGHFSNYVERIEAVLANGSVVEFENNFDPTQRPDSDKAAAIARNCLNALAGKDSVITEALPKTPRNRSGYNIAGICHNQKIDLARLLTGSEGTLAVFTKITLRTVELPPAKALIQFEFDSLEEMAKAVPIIVDTGAVACELMDNTLITLAFDALPKYRDVLPADATAILLVEHTGQNQEQVKEKIKKTDAAVGAIASGRKTFFDPAQQERIWKSRKDAGPLLQRRRGKEHPTEFMEDVSVGDRLGEYIAGLKKIAKQYDIMMSFYGHAGDGELHIRPYIDLSQPQGVEKMKAIASDVFSLAWSLGGSISGEHADGLVRAAYIRHQYGDQYYDLLCKIKNIFDPDGVMNPGKIISADTDVMIKNLKADFKFLPERLKTDLHFEKNQLAEELDQCSGCGLCLSKDPDSRMCPIFRALENEMGSSRAKANVLRLWASGTIDESEFESAEFRKFLDLCINCKACAIECPSGIDISLLMTTARAQYVARKGLRRSEFIFSHNRYLSSMGGFFAPVSNFVMRMGLTKWVLEKLVGFAKTRTPPAFEKRPFLKAASRYLAACEPIENPVDKVAYFVDTYANFNDHELGFAVIEVLRQNNIEVILPQQRPAPLPAGAYGDVKTAQKDMSFNVRSFTRAIHQGYKIVCSEPSAALFLKQELRHFVTGKDAELLSKNTHELMSYLLDLSDAGKLKPPANPKSRDFLYHCPCHAMALGTAAAGVELLKKLCQANITDLKTGCCGLAGTFGMQKKNYDLSSKISQQLANALAASKTKDVLTECAACKMQIEHISDKQVTHPIKVLAQAYES